MRYPYAKLDIVAVPDFAAGAMENPGLVTFRDVLLLLDPKHATTGLRRDDGRRSSRTSSRTSGSATW